MSFLREFLHLVATNFGALVGIFFGVLACIAYWRGELGDFIRFCRDMLCGADGQPSSKNAGYFMGAAVLCWSYAKITLAICRRIDAMQAFDPTWIFGILVSAIAGLVGVVVLGASAIQAKLAGKLGGPPDASAQTIGRVETLIQSQPPGAKPE